MHPVPAAVTACRKTQSCTSPPANTPGNAGLGRTGHGLDVAVGVKVDLTDEELGHRGVADGDEERRDRHLATRLGLRSSTSILVTRSLATSRTSRTSWLNSTSILGLRTPDLASLSTRGTRRDDG